MDIRKILQKIPGRPGVYIMKDGEGKPLYVGKAKNLKKRVVSYFSNSPTSSRLRGAGRIAPWTRVMVNLVRDIETIVTQNELEALLLENNLIKSYKTPFNIKMRDDKTYPYIKITNEEFPRMIITRRIEQDGAKYFGPYLSAYAMRETVELLQRVFGIVTHTYRKGQRACLNYQIGLCSAPYAGKISPEDYADNVDKATRLLAGEYKGMLKDVKKQMNEASAAMEFEKAANLRNQLAALTRIIDQQRVVSTGQENRDVIAVVSHYSLASGEVMIVRDGKVVGNFHVILAGVEGKKKEEIIQNLVSQYYLNAKSIPREIVLSNPIEDEDLIVRALKRRGVKTRFIVPKRGEKKQLVELALHNARHHLEQEVGKAKLNESVLEELKHILHLERLPRRIEAYDISNLGETEAVGAMVAFVDGEPVKEHYRKFIIKSVAGQNDTAMMAEIVKRRMMNTELPRPNLMLIDGGKGQLAAVWKILKDMGIDNVYAIGLAKKWELIFTVGSSRPIALNQESPALLMLMRIRDEVHRFGLGFHRQRRSKKFLKS